MSNQSGPQATTKPTLAAVMRWLEALLSEQGQGEYTLTVRANGSVTVRKRVDPVRFDFDQVQHAE